MKSIIFGILGASLLLSQPVNAQNGRQAVEQKRIVNGAKSGALTPAETRRLESQQRAIHQEKRAARADGIVTNEERREIRRSEQRASRGIYRAKHNARRR